MNNNKVIIVAGGCFWGVQHYFKQVKGVVKTKVGYTGGYKDNPQYEEVCSEETGHTEAVYIEYNPNETDLNTILKHFFKIVDPTCLNYQGMDFGTQYRSAIFYPDKKDKEIIENYIKNIKDSYEDEIVLQVLSIDKFWEAEDHHQDYLEKNPYGYCHLSSDQYKSCSDIDKKANLANEMDK